MKKYFLYFLFLGSSLSLYSQDVIKYGTPQPAGIKEACKGFSLTPGFSFKAVSGSSLTLRINTAACGIAETRTNISANKNYIVTITPQGQTKEVTHKDGVVTVDRTIEGDVNVLTQIQYFDGLGRPEQKIDFGVSPSRKDILHLQEYDAIGRESRSWLPVNSSINSAEYRNPDDIKARSNTELKDSRAFNEPEYEASPLNRVLKQYGPGDAWRNNPVAIEYLTNTSSGDLACANYISGDNRAAIEISRSGNYTDAQLYVTKTTNEDGNISYEFKNKLGQVILTRQMDGSAHDTYYVYDNFGNLKAVLPPMAVDAINANAAELNPGSSVRRNLAYLYTYDNRNRCTGKKLPGADWIYYVYDKADRVIFTQDGEQRTKGEWLYTIPDAFGRIVLTGICTSMKQEAVSAESPISVGVLDNIVVNATWSKATNNYKGYTISGASPSNFSVLTANYYDNHEYLGYNSLPADLAYTSRSDYPAQYANSKGLLTGSMTALLDGSNTYLYTAMYYDYKGNMVQQKSTNHLGGIESEYIAYTFTGNPTQKLHIHTAAGKTTLTEQYSYAYDHAGRMTVVKHKLNNGSEVLLAQNTYDELGRLHTNTAGNQVNLKTSYAYNIRSWMNTITNYHFIEALTYTHGGNISTQEWRQAGKARKYTFAYDKLSRILRADYAGDGNFGTSYLYDKMGNMTSLTRYGITAKGVNDQVVDNLTFLYNGNQLRNITDAGPNVSLSTSAEFKDYSKGTEDEYTFNQNGAMIKDLNKGISSITYNQLSLPRQIDIKSPVAEARNEYTYTATGAKLKVVKKWNPSYSTTPVMGTAVTPTQLTLGETTDYVGNKIYEDGVLKRILTGNGYIEGNTYYFYVKDHLGNNRIVADASASVIQSSQYYPFGMDFGENPTAEQEKQPYKYNGKELDQSHGLNLYDYNARHLDNAYGRFTTMDPLSEKYYSISPYAYCANNPMRYIDPTGMDWDDPKEAEALKRKIEEKVASLRKDISDNQAKLDKGGLSDKEMSKLVSKISEAESRISNLNTSSADIDKLANDHNNIYVLSEISGGEHKVRQGDDGKIYIETSGDALSIHEITHVSQSLDAGGLKFSPKGELRNVGDLFDGNKKVRTVSAMEVEAYKMQYSYDTSFPGRTTSLQGIDVHSVGNIKKDDGSPVYPIINDYANFLRQQSKFKSY